MSHHARDAHDLGGRLPGGREGAEPCVHDVIPVVRPKGVSVLAPKFDRGSERLQGVGGEAPSERVHLDGNRDLRSEARHELGFVHDHDELLGRGSDDLLAEQRAAQPFDQIEFRIHLIGSVDAEVRRRPVFE